MGLVRTCACVTNADALGDLVRIAYFTLVELRSPLPLTIPGLWVTRVDSSLAGVRRWACDVSTPGCGQHNRETARQAGLAVTDGLGCLTPGLVEPWQ